MQNQRKKTKPQIADILDCSFRVLAEVSPIGIYLTDNAGKCFYVNPAWCRMAGLTAGEASGDGWINAIHHDDRERISSEWKDFIKGDIPWASEYRFLNKKGDSTWVYGVAEKLKDKTGLIKQILGTNIDISKKKSAELELLASTSNLSSLTSYTPDCIIVNDIRLRYTFVVNPQLGLTVDQYIGKTDYDLPISKKEAEKITAIKRKVLESGKSYNLMVPLKNLNKETEYFEGSFIPTYDSNGKVNGLIGYFRNVTRQKKSNDAIKEYQKKLLNLTRHLEEIRERERVQIAMNLHDDLGQRLTSLNLDLAWLKSRMGVQSKGVRKKMDDMSQSIFETIESIKEVTSFLRPSILYELGLVAAFTWQLKKFEKQSGIKSHFTFMPEEFRIDDHISLIIYRILQESLTNIIRHSEATIVEIALICKKNMIVLIIKDNGVGIDNDKVNSITSMGIAGLMERVRSVSGTLSVVGEKGTGTKLEASIPLKKKMNHD